jgi:hypothetical protein
MHSPSMDALGDGGLVISNQLSNSFRMYLSSEQTSRLEGTTRVWGLYIKDTRSEKRVPPETTSGVDGDDIFANRTSEKSWFKSVVTDVVRCSHDNYHGSGWQGDAAEGCSRAAWAH